MQQVILVSGPPAAGKSTIAKKLSEQTGFLYLSKDMVKEELYDKHTKSNILHNSWYEKESKKLFMYKVKKLLEEKNDIIIESDFSPDADKGRIEKLLQFVDTRELYVTASGWSLLSRFVKRRERYPGQKHLKHHDRMWYPAMTWIAINKSFGRDFVYRPLHINAKVMTIDTTDFSSVNMTKIFDFCLRK